MSKIKIPTAETLMQEVEEITDIVAERLSMSPEQGSHVLSVIENSRLVAALYQSAAAVAGAIEKNSRESQRREIATSVFAAFISRSVEVVGNQRASAERVLAGVAVKYADALLSALDDGGTR